MYKKCICTYVDLSSFMRREHRPDARAGPASCVVRSPGHGGFQGYRGGDPFETKKAADVGWLKECRAASGLLGVLVAL